MNKIKINNKNIPIISYDTIIVGTGAAGFNAADSLYDLGEKNIAIITEGIKMGTSRNTGSDKQTYYKFNLAGNEEDSITKMATTYFKGGAMNGDVALSEAAMSARCFYKLVEAGVPFPHNEYGEYVGYKTDHDPEQRATSAGPLTSKFMTEALEKKVFEKNIKIFDNHIVVKILTNKEKTKAIGLVVLNTDKALEENFGITIFKTENIIYATGGPSGMYYDNVYPESQCGANGIAFEAGAKGINLTESQYGIASIKFRWNLSGTYQQVLPKYISTDLKGNDEKEFLNEYFSTVGKMLDGIFLKGYQWPFDPKKINNEGSSLVDLLVYNEKQKGRRVFLDFRSNPEKASNENGELNFNLLGDEALQYIINSKADFGTPIERLKFMNPLAIDLYKNNGIDLENEMLEIAVCAQHNNGGLYSDINQESNLKNFYPVGEACGIFGIYRPGGSALNSTQVTSLKAATNISQKEKGDLDLEIFKISIENSIEDILNIAKNFLNQKTGNDLNETWNYFKKEMSKSGGHIRNKEKINQLILELKKSITGISDLIKIESPFLLRDAFRFRETLLCQLVYLEATNFYINSGYGSRGSYLIIDNNSENYLEVLGKEYSYIEPNNNGFDLCLETEYDFNNQIIKSEFKKVKPIPEPNKKSESLERDLWFENVWRDYRKKFIK